MKTILIMIILTLMSWCQIMAQQVNELKDRDVRGLYVTPSDFKENKLFNSTGKQHKGHKIKLKQFFISPQIISFEQRKKSIFYKDSIFSIQLKNGRNYRFINRFPFYIADTSFLFIYTRQSIKVNYKQVGPRNRIINTPIMQYYFSFGDHKHVYPLTLENIHKYVFSNPLAQTTGCNYFTTDSTLYKINKRTGHFVINDSIFVGR